MGPLQLELSVEQLESGGGADDVDGDDVVAKESWDGFLSRNQSKLVDLFYGQYKSRLDCPKCKKTSVTFDPYVYLSGNHCYAQNYKR